MIGVALGTMALIIVLSVFNGLEEFIRELYSSFDPELKIQPVSGKSFLMQDFPKDKIAHLGGVAGITEVIEESAYVKYQDAEMVVTMKGVGDSYLKEQRLRNNIVEGRLKLSDGNAEFAVLGRGVQSVLNITSLNDMYPIQVFYPKRNSNLLDPVNSVNHENIMPAGIFAIEKQFDENYVITSLRFAEKLFEYKDRRTAVEITLRDHTKTNIIKNQIQLILGTRYHVLNRDEQHSSLIRVIKLEKLFVFLTFSFIIAVASINIFFSLTMLAIDKRKDIAILMALGSGKKIVRNIFYKEGAIIAFSGAIIGLILGILLCVIQQRFGIISLGIETSVINAYPVKMNPMDFVFISFSIIFITLVFSIRPAILAAKSDAVQYLS
jgi:lipoprotein-releasing system permease protein